MSRARDWDYKGPNPPKPKDFKNGWIVPLLLEALMVHADRTEVCEYVAHRLNTDINVMREWYGLRDFVVHVLADRSLHRPDGSYRVEAGSTLDSPQPLMIHDIEGWEDNIAFDEREGMPLARPCRVYRESEKEWEWIKDMDREEAHDALRYHEYPGVRIGDDLVKAA